MSDPLLLYFTSGTTARPKLVLHSHQSYPVGHLSTMYWLGVRPGDIHLNKHRAAVWRWIKKFGLGPPEIPPQRIAGRAVSRDADARPYRTSARCFAEPAGRGLRPAESS